MRLGILCLCFLILMVETTGAQELDDKIPFLDEPIITPEVTEKDTSIRQTPTTKEKPERLQKDEEGTITPLQRNNLTEEYTKGTETPPLETLSSESLVGTTTTELGTITSVEKVQEGTETPPLGTLSSESLVGTTATELGTITVEKVQEGTETPPLGTLSSESLVGTTATELGTITSVEKVQEGTETPPLGTLTPGTTTLGTTTAEIGTPTLLNTGLILIPTAYRRDNKLGFNMDFICAYYIGELWHSMNNGEFFAPIKFLPLSFDFKFSLLKKTKQIPHFGAGYEWFLVIQGAAATPAQMGGEISGKSDRFGYPYIILSEKFKYLKCHLGMMFGEIGKLVNPLSEFAALDSQKAIIFGLDTKLFNRDINIEGIYPTGDEFYLLINTSVERFLGFDLGFMKMPAGFSIIGYFGIRLPLFPHLKDRK